jgi:hypothetical protein
MVSISSPSARPTAMQGRGDSRRDGADHLFATLVFSLVGLLTACLALVMQGETALAPLRFGLIAGAAPIAAMVALRLAGHTDENPS